MKVTPLTGALFGGAAAGLLYMTMADRKPAAHAVPGASPTASLFQPIAVNRTKQALAYFGKFLLDQAGPAF